jgi:threonine aldolase
MPSHLKECGKARWVSGTIDLRSDTVTLPSPEMRRAMYEAELGDDVFGDDPTVNRLEERAAEILGKEAALFVTSGTQGNLVAVLTHATRGDEIVVGDQSHMLNAEVGGASALAGAQVRAVPNRPDGTLDAAALRASIRDRTDLHQPFTSLICLENTHNRCGGAVLDPAYIQQVQQFAHAQGIAVHLDGARLFNAAVALGVPAAALAAGADSVTFCASKGLAAPVGSLLCGPRAFVDRARRWRKMLGGGMRQAGVIAAGALYALDHMVERLAEDHAHARTLAEGLASIPGIALDPGRVRTNIVILDLASSGRSPRDVVGALAARGVLAVPFGPTQVRMVTHYGIDAGQIEHALAVTRTVFRDG